MLLTLDDVAYTAKPDRAEFARLMNRMKKTAPQEVDKRVFCEHVRAGRSWVGGAFDDGLKTFRSWQVAALDFDDGRLSPVEVLDRCELLGIAPLCLYFTLSATVENPRFRLVFMLDKPLADEAKARDCIATLLSVFPTADKKCSNANRIFLGSQGEVWTVFEVWSV